MTRLPGKVASQGVASGTLRRDAVAARSAGRPADSVAGAVIEAAWQLRALQAAATSLGSDILEFQLALLEDDGLVLEMVQKGAAHGDAARAIAEVLEEQIASYRAAADARFAARAADLEDLKSRLLGALKGAAAPARALPAGTILIAEEMTPSRFLELDRAKIAGIVDQKGSETSHVALLARAEGVPMLVAAGPVAAEWESRPALLDAAHGELVLDPDAALIRDRAGQASAQDVPSSEGEGPAVLSDGETVRVNLTVNALASLDEAPPEWFDGIGLVRTELLITDAEEVLNAGRQASLYRPLFDWAREKPVTIRLLDGGGDKQVPGYAPPPGGGGFLGVRGARLLMRRGDVLRAQLAAILDAAEGRPVRIMAPMITLPEEMRFFRTELDRAIDASGADRVQAALGMMVETPAAALDIDRFDADFFALGTNDLAQYVLAASRDSEALPLGGEIPPAVLELVRRVVEHGRNKGLAVSVCGDVAASEESLGRFLACGVRSFSIPSRFAPRFKQYIRTGL